MYTPQPMPAETTLEHVRDLVSAQGFEFPVGLDSRWETMNRYWLRQSDADLAGATFLIDRQGIIRYIQPDGESKNDAGNRALRKKYEKLANKIENLLQPEEGPAGKKSDPR